MTQQVNRLPQGGRLERGQRIHFWYDDKAYEGYLGDTLASALLANGVHLVGRSFKYHRPRGIYSAGAEEPNALVQLELGARTEPNRRATEIELYEGLRASSQNCWPSVNFDLGAISAKLSRILPAGFYYKTFMWPASLWLTYEKFIRKSAGLGKSPTEIDPDSYDKTFAHCDVLVVGGGPAGVQAAYAAGCAGARVMLLDEKNEFGGTLLSETALINGIDTNQWIEQKIAALNEMEQVTLLSRTTVTGYYDYNFLVANQRIAPHMGADNADRKQTKSTATSPKERLWKIRAKQVVLATGAFERPLVFADNDRPGVMLAGAIRSYINRYGVLPGKHIVILTNNDSAYLTAVAAKTSGAVVHIVDVRHNLQSVAVRQAQELGINIIENATISGVGYGKRQIQKAEIMSLSEDGCDVSGVAQTIDCDVVGVSGGWTPIIHLFSQAKGKLTYRDDLHCFVAAQAAVNNPCIMAGASQASYRLDDCLSEGFAAGCAAAKAVGFKVSRLSSDARSGEPDTDPLRPLWILPCDHPIGQGKKKHFHELHNDSTVADIELAMREGFESVEHLKRYTTTGMGTDQGKTSNINALTVMAKLRNLPIVEVGTTTFRPPYTPLTFGAIVGHERRQLFLQQRKTAMHPWHDKMGAVYEDVGDWKRPHYFPKLRESMDDAVQRECLAARNACALLDASTLGKIDLQGKDTVKLLNMLYTNAWDQLAPGRCRYGLMLNEHGMVFDDGVTTCLAENHYHMTTTSGGAARVMGWIEEWLQTEWPQMEVYATSVTEQWAVASLNGPYARKVLEQVIDMPDSLNNDSFPFMSMREARVADIPARIYRISFTGELAFEINVPARYGLALWQALMDAGKQYDICPYGTEAMHVLRAEKGFIIVGQDTDGTVTPMDLGMDWIVSKKKSDFLGKRSFTRTDTAKAGRKQLVGLLTEDPQFVLPEGSHVVEAVKPKPPMAMLGHVSSSYMSPNVGHSIAMALIKDGFNRKGQTLDVALIDGTSHKVQVTEPLFFDKQGERIHG